MVSKNCIDSSILRETKFDHDKKTKTEPVDRFIDLLIEGKETILPRENSVILTIANAVQQEIESRHLPPVDLKTFSGDPSQWPEFIENFKACAHTKPTFNDTMRMESLISVLRGEVKKEIESIGTNSMFYATALKALKREYGNPLLVSHLKIKKLLQIQISHLFNPVANIVASQETKSKDVRPSARSNHGMVLQSKDNKLTFGYATINTNSINVKCLKVKVYQKKKLSSKRKDSVGTA